MSHDYDADVASVLADQERERRAQLRTAGSASPDEAAKVRRLADETGLAPETVRADRDGVARDAAIARDAPLLATSPRLADWFARGDNGEVAHDDLTNLSTWEKMLHGALDAPARFGRSVDGFFARAGENWKTGQAIAELSQLQAAERAAAATKDGLAPTADPNIFRAVTPAPALTHPEQMRKLVLERQVSAHPLAGFDPLGAILQSLPAMSGAVGEGLKRADEAGQAGAPLATGATEFAAGFTDYNSQMLAGQAWDYIKDLRDQSGAPIDPRIAAQLAWEAGTQASAIESLADAAGGEVAFDALKGAAGKIGRKALVRATLRRAAANLGLRVAEGATIEGVTEGLQQRAQIEGGESAKSRAEAAGSAPFARRSEADKLAEELVNAYYGAQAGGAFAGAAGSLDFAIDARRAARAGSTRALLANIADLAARSKLKTRLPAAFADALDTMAEGSPAETVRVSADAFAEYFQSAGEDPAAVADEIKGVGRAKLADALAHGGDVEIPLGSWASQIVGTDHEAGLADHAKLRAEDMTQAELRAAAQSPDFWKQSGEAARRAAAEVEADPKQAIEDDLFATLKGAGVQDDLINRPQAQLQAALMVRAAERTGADPWAFYQRVKPRVVGRLGGEAIERGGRGPWALGWEYEQARAERVRDVVLPAAFGGGRAEAIEAPSEMDLGRIFGQQRRERRPQSARWGITEGGQAFAWDGNIATHEMMGQALGVDWARQGEAFSTEEAARALAAAKRPARAVAPLTALAMRAGTGEARDLVLDYLDGDNDETIAAAYGLTPGSVATKLSDLREALTTLAGLGRLDEAAARLNLTPDALTLFAEGGRRKRGRPTHPARDAILNAAAHGAAPAEIEAELRHRYQNLDRAEINRQIRQARLAISQKSSAEPNVNAERLANEIDLPLRFVEAELAGAIHVPRGPPGRLSDENKADILRQLAAGRSPSAIAADFGVSRGRVSQLAAAWRATGELPPGQPSGGRSFDQSAAPIAPWVARALTPSDIASLRAALASGAPAEEILAHPALKKIDEAKAPGATMDAAQRNDPDFWAGRTYQLEGQTMGAGAYTAAIRGRFEASVGGPLRHEGRVVIITGQPGAGKSTLRGALARLLGATPVDADAVREGIEGYDGGHGSQRAHAEAVALRDKITRDLLDENANVVIERVGDDLDGQRAFIAALRDQGFQVLLANVAVDFDTSVRRATRRGLEDGRFIPPEILLRQADHPQATYAALVAEGGVDGYVQIDGNGPRGQEQLTQTGALDGFGFTEDALAGELARLGRDGGFARDLNAGPADNRYDGRSGQARPLAGLVPQGFASAEEFAQALRAAGACIARHGMASAPGMALLGAASPAAGEGGVMLAHAAAGLTAGAAAGGAAYNVAATKLADFWQNAFLDHPVTVTPDDVRRAWAIAHQEDVPDSADAAAHAEAARGVLRAEVLAALPEDAPLDQLLDVTAELAGVDPAWLKATVGAESGGDAGAEAAGSSASGLGQFTDATWRGVYRAHAAAWGLDPNLDDASVDALVYEPRVAGPMLAEFAKDNAATFKAKIGRDPSWGELYVMHFAGPRQGPALIAGAARGAPDARAFFSAAADNPTNHRIFYDASGEARSARGAVAELTRGFPAKTFRAGD